MSWPLNSTWPSDGGMMPATTRPRVDLPHPDSPTSPTTSPRLMAISTWSTARTVSFFGSAPMRCASARVRRAAASWVGPNRLETPRNSTIGELIGGATPGYPGGEPPPLHAGPPRCRPIARLAHGVGVDGPTASRAMLGLSQTKTGAVHEPD